MPFASACRAGHSWRIVSIATPRAASCSAGTRRRSAGSAGSSRAVRGREGLLGRRRGPARKGPGPHRAAPGEALDPRPWLVDGAGAGRRRPGSGHRLPGAGAGRRQQPRRMPAAHRAHAPAARPPGGLGHPIQGDRQYGVRPPAPGRCCCMPRRSPCRSIPHGHRSPIDGTAAGRRSCNGLEASMTGAAADPALEARCQRYPEEA